MDGIGGYKQSALVLVKQHGPDQSALVLLCMWYGGLSVLFSFEMWLYNTVNRLIYEWYC